MRVADLSEELLREVRTAFYADVPDRQFFQERNLLLQAVTYPADWLKRHGARLPAANYRIILRRVIDTIRQHGDVKRIRRFSAYFLLAVQRHMQHHGEEYYLASKRPRAAGKVVPHAIGNLQIGAPGEDVVGTMMEVRRLLRSKGGRKRQTKGSAIEGDLFAQGSVRPQPASS